MTAASSSTPLTPNFFRPNPRFLRHKTFFHSVFPDSCSLVPILRAIYIDIGTLTISRQQPLICRKKGKCPTVIPPHSMILSATTTSFSSFAKIVLSSSPSLRQTRQTDQFNLNFIITCTRKKHKIFTINNAVTSQ